MACLCRTRTGRCDHAQCPFPENTGYHCVDVVENFCEVGLNCEPQCPYSYAEKLAQVAEDAFCQYYGR